jgi:tetratricopeptide (TPR) repeat protein
MKHARGRRLAEISLALVAVVACAKTGRGQSVNDAPAPASSPAATLELPTHTAADLQHAVDAHDYLTAEKLLLAEIDRDPKSAHAARLLAYAGTVYFLNQDYMGAAIAWKKSEAIAPLDPKLRFTLAMDYIQLNHPDWARKELESLAELEITNALYPYWLGRIDYDGHQYNEAIRHFAKAIELDPKMARAYDNLGLCYYYQNQNELAIENYKKAIELDRGAEHPSPWPYLNLAITEQFLNDPKSAETNLHEALRLDPEMTRAHFQLGTVLEDEGRLKDALVELREAARLDATYAEPHMAIARIDHKLGNESEARDEVQAYLRLHPHSTPQ